MVWLHRGTAGSVIPADLLVTERQVAHGHHRLAQHKTGKIESNYSEVLWSGSRLPW